MLRLELDRIPLWRGDHVGVKQLVEDFATYLYLPRLQGEEVLIDAIQDGLRKLLWQTETFAYAESWDEGKCRYIGLVAGQDARVLNSGESVLVMPDVAAAQMEAEREVPETGDGTPGDRGRTIAGGAGPVTGTDEELEFVAERVLRRFHGSVKLDSLRIGRDAGAIAEEVVQHLTGLVGADVEVTLEIRADIPDGVPDKAVRDVTENCRTLKFESYGFEKE